MVHLGKHYPTKPSAPLAMGPNITMSQRSHLLHLLHMDQYREPAARSCMGVPFSGTEPFCYLSTEHAIASLLTFFLWCGMPSVAKAWLTIKNIFLRDTVSLQAASCFFLSLCCGRFFDIILFEPLYGQAKQESRQSHATSAALCFSSFSLYGYNSKKNHFLFQALFPCLFPFLLTPPGFCPF